jgi:hypothetical protein
MSFGMQKVERRLTPGFDQGIAPCEPQRFEEDKPEEAAFYKLQFVWGGKP